MMYTINVIDKRLLKTKTNTKHQNTKMKNEKNIAKSAPAAAADLMTGWTDDTLPN